MRREERVTVQGPIKKQQPDGRSHRGRKRENRSIEVYRCAGGSHALDLCPNRCHKVACVTRKSHALSLYLNFDP